MGYTITRNNNIFTITKTGNNAIYVTIYTQTSCDSNQWSVLIPEQFTNDSLIITLPNKDGLYRIFITDNQGFNETLNIPIYTSILKSYIEDVKYVLCGCPCENCKDCDKQEKDYLSVLIKMFAYNIINEGLYNQYLTATNDCIKCNILDANQCILLNESILGDSSNTELMKQIIAYYYLVFYFTDLKLNNNSQTITNTYQYNEILKCIKKLGININCITNNITNFVPK
jgi:hypothetical protein